MLRAWHSLGRKFESYRRSHSKYLNLNELGFFAFWTNGDCAHDCAPKLQQLGFVIHSVKVFMDFL